MRAYVCARTLRRRVFLRPMLLLSHDGRVACRRLARLLARAHGPLTSHVLPRASLVAHARSPRGVAARHESACRISLSLWIPVDVHQMERARHYRGSSTARRDSSPPRSPPRRSKAHVNALCPSPSPRPLFLSRREILTTPRITTVVGHLSFVQPHFRAVLLDGGCSRTPPLSSANHPRYRPTPRERCLACRGYCLPTASFPLVVPHTKVGNHSRDSSRTTDVVHTLQPRMATADRFIAHWARLSSHCVFGDIDEIPLINSRLKTIIARIIEA